MLKLLGLGALVLLAGAAALGFRTHGRDLAQRDRVWTSLLAGRVAQPPVLDPALTVGLPPLAQRYFVRAIRPGTPLHKMVRLEMAGTFTLNGKALPMQARQILAPPERGFVWEAEIGAGLMRFAGSDGYLSDPSGAESWTKFWLRSLIPLARIGGTAEHARAAGTRAMLESLWVPATLLPQMGATWIETGPDTAEIRFAAAPDLPPMQVRLNAEGDMVEVWALRWSDANPDKTYRLQPFGGRVLDWAEFQGFRIPTRVEMGNQWGTPDYAPFFEAQVTRAEY